MDKLMQIRKELQVPKSHYNSFGGFNYRSCEDILNAVKPLLETHGLTLTITDRLECPCNGWVFVVAQARLMDGECVLAVTESMARQPESKKGMDDSQISGCASSYARKYALNGLFLIDDVGDADMQTPAENPAKKKPVDMTAMKTDKGKAFLLAFGDPYAAIAELQKSKDVTPEVEDYIKGLYRENSKREA